MKDKKSIKIAVNEPDEPIIPEEAIAADTKNKIEVRDFTEVQESADVDATPDGEVSEDIEQELVAFSDEEQTNAIEAVENIAADTTMTELEEQEAEGPSTEPIEEQETEEGVLLEETEENSGTESDVDPAGKTVGDAIDEIETESDVFDSDPEIDQAVDDIVRTESDAAIAETDAKLAALQAMKEKKSFPQKIRGAFRTWWDNKPARYGVLAGLVVLFGAVVLLPTTRYTVLNVLGVRVSSSMTVIDSQTRLPLKNITVELQDKTATTNDEGQVAFTDLKLGDSQLVITKRGYADENREIVLGWGSNPLGEQALVATGEQFTFVLSDWKSGMPITNAEAVSGENSAKADDSGKIIITVGEEDVTDVEIAVSADGYRTEKFSGDTLAENETKVLLVPSKKHVFVSNRNGEYDLYTIDVDGKNEQVLLASTGKEREVPVVVQHPTKDVVAFVSSREGEENKDGFILDGLFVIDAVNGEKERITRSEQLQVIGWSGDTLIYLQVVEGTSQGSDERSKIIGYNFATKERIDLAMANYFNDVELVGDQLRYAVSSFAIPESQAKLYKIDIDGKNKEKLVDTQVWNIFRTAHDTLLFSAVDQKWFKQVAQQPVEEISQQSSPVALQFVDSPDGKQTAWVEVRDGKGVLLKSTIADFKEEQVLALPGLNEVLYWANASTVVFRVISTDETADYVLNLAGGEMQKVIDVTATRNSYF